VFSKRKKKKKQKYFQQKSERNTAKSVVVAVVVVVAAIIYFSSFLFFPATYYKIKLERTNDERSLGSVLLERQKLRYYVPRYQQHSTAKAATTAQQKQQQQQRTERQRWQLLPCTVYMHIHEQTILIHEILLCSIHTQWYMRTEYIHTHSTLVPSSLFTSIRFVVLPSLASLFSLCLPVPLVPLPVAAAHTLFLTVRLYFVCRSFGSALSLTPTYRRASVCM